MEPSELMSEAPEVEAQTPLTSPPSEKQQLRRRSLRGSSSDVSNDEAATLAELWPSRRPKSASSTALGKVKKPLKKKGPTSKIKERHSNSITKLTLSLRSGKTRSYGKYMSGFNKSGTPSIDNSAAMVRAKEVRSSLDPNFPSFIKSVVKSNVGISFFMGLPGPFCKSYLPRHDATIIIEDEHGKQYETSYIGYRTGLRIGWKQFAVDHNLLEGDVLVFQLVEASKFKVHIIRAGNRTEDEHATVVNLDSPAEMPETQGAAAPSSVVLACKAEKRKRPKSLPLTILQKKKPKSNQQNSSTPDPGEQSGNHSSEVGSEVLESSKSTTVPKLHFKDIANFEDFKISIDGVLVDSEFQVDTRRTYYDLCRSQNDFLHENLADGINSKLIIGAISEIVGISDSIRACDLITGKDKFSTWDRTLQAFELLGVNVGFLRARVGRLRELAFECESGVQSRKLAEAKSKRAFIEDEMRKLEQRLSELEKENEKLGNEIESLRPEVESYEVGFRKEVSAPW